MVVKACALIVQNQQKKQCHFQWVWAYIMYKKVHEDKDQLLYADVQAQAGNDDTELKLFLQTLSVKNKAGYFGSKMQKQA